MTETSTLAVKTTIRTKALVASIGDTAYATDKVIKSVLEDLKDRIQWINQQITPSSCLILLLLFGTILFFLTSLRLLCNSYSSHNTIKCLCRRCLRLRKLDDSEHSYHSYKIDEGSDSENHQLGSHLTINSNINDTSLTRALLKL